MSAVICHMPLPRIVSQNLPSPTTESPKPCQKSCSPPPKSKTCWQWGLNPNTTPRRYPGLLKSFWIHCLELSSSMGLVLRIIPLFPHVRHPKQQKGHGAGDPEPPDCQVAPHRARSLLSHSCASWEEPSETGTRGKMCKIICKPDANLIILPAPQRE